MGLQPSAMDGVLFAPYCCMGLTDDVVQELLQKRPHFTGLVIVGLAIAALQMLHYIYVRFYLKGKELPNRSNNPGLPLSKLIPQVGLAILISKQSNLLIVWSNRRSGESPGCD